MFWSAWLRTVWFTFYTRPMKSYQGPCRWQYDIGVSQFFPGCWELRRIYSNVIKQSRWQACLQRRAVSASCAPIVFVQISHASEDELSSHGRDVRHLHSSTVTEGNRLSSAFDAPWCGPKLWSTAIENCPQHLSAPPINVVWSSPRHTL